MQYPHIDRPALLRLLERLDETYGRPGRLYLIGETTHLFEGWRDWTTHIELTADVVPEDRSVFSNAVADLGREFGVPVFDESPADVIVLPDGHEDRVRAAAMTLENLKLCHFDPYSVAFRFIARGDEPDYHLVLMYLEKGWVTFEEMDAKLEALLPRFTAETIQQDPAEFRRKYKGLLQMWRSVRPRTTHRPTTV